MKKLTLVVKRIVMSLCMLYTFNLITGAVGLFIPINIISISSVSVLGLPAIFGLLVILQFM